MAITYEWQIPKVETFPTHTDGQNNTESDVVHTIYWKLIATDDVNNVFVSNSGKVSIDTDDLSGFTAFNSVTKAQAITWVEAWYNKYPDSNVATIKARLDRKIAEKITPISEIKTLSS
jgi:hypothetical protein